MRKTRKISFALLSLASLTANTALTATVGQDVSPPPTQEQDEKAIVVEGEAKDRVSDDAKPAPRKRMHGGHWMRTTGIVGAVGSGPSDPEKQDDREELYKMGSDQLDWRTVILAQRSAGSPLVNSYAAFDIASCILAGDEGRAVGWFADPPSGNEKKRTRKFTQANAACVNASSATPRLAQMEAALAELLVLRRHAPPPLRNSLVDLDEARAFLGAEANMGDPVSVGRCVAIFAPGHVYDLFYLPPGSKQEKAALAGLYSEAPECGLSSPPEFSLIDQRGGLARGLYDWLERGAD